MMDGIALGKFLRAAQDDLLRVECLDYYEPDEADFQRYLAGEATPDMTRMGAWLERLRGEQARGLRRRRVHVVQSPVSKYVAFECEFAYAYNIQAGEEIRILDLAERTGVPGSRMGTDFWMVDGHDVAVMHYTPEGAFTGAHLAPPAARDTYRTAARALWDAAEPFASWWNRHPEYHRGQKVA